MIKERISAIAKKITATKSRLTQGKAQKGGIKLWDCLSLIEPEVLAAIAAKKALDLIGQGKDNKGKHKNTHTNVCNSIGAAVEAESRFRWYEHTAGKEWKACKARYFKPTTGTRQKEIVSKTIMNRRGYRWATWSQPKRVQVGAFMLDCVMAETGWFTSAKPNPNSRKNNVHLIRLSDEMENLKQHLIEVAALLAPLTWPMLCEPAPWSNEDRGGYLTNELRQGFSLVRRQRSAVTLGETPLAMLNNLQRVPYRVNPFTYQLLKALESRRRDLDSFVLRENEPPIPRPETEDEAVLKTWRRQRTEQENRNAALAGKRYRTLETILMADRFHLEPQIFVPWSFDYRGRVYPLISFMSPQGTGMEKSLYLFAESRPVTERAEFWLAVHLANTAGYDKQSMTERVAWVKDNHELITAIATDPISNIGLLESFDDPWCGAAACDEYYHCVILRDRLETSLPVATDATCSGLQHLGAMTLDAATASLVNVTGGERPNDAYKAVLHETLRLLREPTDRLMGWVERHNRTAQKQYDKAIEKDPDADVVPPTPVVLPNPGLADWGERVGRKLAKRVVMTVPYAATPHSNRGYIREAILDHEHEVEEKLMADLDRMLTKQEMRRPTSAELTTLTHVMLVAMEEIVPGPIKVMNWIKEQVSVFFDNNPDGVITWDTPTGFPMLQDKRVLEIQRIQTQLLGSTVDGRVCVGEKGVDVNKHRNCSAPNFIHSMDASLLHASFECFDGPFTLIHDSILTTATDMDEMASTIRQEFAVLYQPGPDGLLPLERYAQSLGVAAPEHLILRTLDITDVIGSDYFFC